MNNYEFLDSPCNNEREHEYKTAEIGEKFVLFNEVEQIGEKLVICTPCNKKRIESNINSNADFLRYMRLTDYLKYYTFESIIDRMTPFTK